VCDHETSWYEEARAGLQSQRNKQTILTSKCIAQRVAVLSCRVRASRQADPIKVPTVVLITDLEIYKSEGLKRLWSENTTGWMEGRLGGLLTYSMEQSPS
jgi:hypothetical protein